MGGVDSDLDGDGPATNVLPIEGSDGLLLFLLAANIDEAIALALPGLSPPPANDASRDNVDAGLGEYGAQCGVIGVESKVGDEEHCLGGLACRVFAVCAWHAGCTRLLGTSLLGSFVLVGGCSTFGSGLILGRGTLCLAL